MSVTIPNLLSLVRMGLVPLFIIAVVDGESFEALIVFLAAGLTDALDGFIARVFRQQSVLGMYLDPIADKLLLMSAFVVLTIPGLHPGISIPLWVTIFVIARDLIIVTVALILYLAVGITRFPPTLLSKVNTTVQIACIILVLGSGIFSGLYQAALWSTFLVGFLTVASGIDYIVLAARDRVDPSVERRPAEGAPGSGEEAP